jgi:hypothetical protein
MGKGIEDRAITPLIMNKFLKIMIIHHICPKIEKSKSY